MIAAIRMAAMFAHNRKAYAAPDCG
jgi:hypothetical protein